MEQRSNLSKELKDGRRILQYVLNLLCLFFGFFIVYKVVSQSKTMYFILILMTLTSIFFFIKQPCLGILNAVDTIFSYFGFLILLTNLSVSSLGRRNCEKCSPLTSSLLTLSILYFILYIITILYNSYMKTFVKCQINR